MQVEGLGYLGLSVGDVDAWESFAGALGVMVDRRGDDHLSMRIDDRPWRVAADRGTSRHGLGFLGWEFADDAALDAAGRELRDVGVRVVGATDDECDARRVRRILRAEDPAGFALELFTGWVLDHRPFVSPHGVSGFVTETPAGGQMGLGHVVVGTPSLDQTVAFYTEVMGFRISDFWRPAGADVVFARCNPRHHSIAFVAAEEPALYHFMLEARTVDDVGAALDRVQDAGATISMGLGRHPNDLMLSFYVRSPSGFDVEFGCGGRHVDEATWTVNEITAPSSWGHRRPG